MNDYFFEYSDARGRLAGSRVVINYLLEVLTTRKDDDILREVAIEVAIGLAEDELKYIDEILCKKIGE